MNFIIKKTKFLGGAHLTTLKYYSMAKILACNFIIFSFLFFDPSGHQMELFIYFGDTPLMKVLFTC